MSETRWTAPPEHPRLDAGVVDVWRADLARAGEGERALLAPEERTRAARFVQEGHGARWAGARGILRALLGRYAGADPAALRFVAGEHGKLALAAPPAALRFNLSHSGDVALYAVALDREVGVDVELPHRTTVDTVAIAARMLGAAEAARLRALDPPAREREFLRGWVRYEAVLKCHGTGIGGAESAPPPDREPWVRELDAGAPAAAALAVEGGPCEVRCWQWPAATG